MTTGYTDGLIGKYYRMREQMNYLYSSLEETVGDQVSKVIIDKNTNKKLNVIDIGCGDGVYCRMLCDRFESSINKIVGIDISESQIKYAQQCTNSKEYPNISYFTLDAQNIDLEMKKMNMKMGDDHDPGFDIGLGIWVFAEAENKIQLAKQIENAYNVLNENGCLVCYVTTNDNLSKNIKNGIYLNDPNFHIKINLGKQLRDNNDGDGDEFEFVCQEGIINFNFGYDDYLCDFGDFICSSQTYYQLFEQAGFKDVYLLKPNEYQCAKDSTNFEKQLFQKLVNTPSNMWQLFVCKK